MNLNVKLTFIEYFIKNIALSMSGLLITNIFLYKVLNDNGYMKLDSFTMKNLEIFSAFAIVFSILSLDRSFVEAVPFL